MSYMVHSFLSPVSNISKKTESGTYVYTRLKLNESYRERINL
jgi:hypothetical protein